MFSRDPITLSTKNWQPQRIATGGSVLKAWRNPAGDSMSLNYFALPPDIGASLTSLDDLRQFYRAQVNPSMGLVETTVVTLDGVPAVRLMIKAPQESAGVIYLGSFTIPRRDFSYVLKFQCNPGGVTGMRESIILNNLLETGEVTIGSEGNLVGWNADPYDPQAGGDALMNRSEESQHDSLFPDHPLSRLRLHMSEAQASVKVSSSVKTAPIFSGRKAESL